MTERPFKPLFLAGIFFIIGTINGLIIGSATASYRIIQGYTEAQYISEARRIIEAMVEQRIDELLKASLK